MNNQYHKILFEHNVCMTTSDGARLYADVYRPDDDRQHPAILHREPYSKDLTVDWGFLNAREYVLNGFAVVVQDIRGYGVSDGELDMDRGECRDGCEAVEWVAAQPWCNGKVCMMGVSYHGSTQLQAAQGAPEHLCAIAPFMVMGGHYRFSIQPNIPGWLYIQFLNAMKLGKREYDPAVEARMQALVADKEHLYDLPEADSRLITGIPEIPEIGRQIRNRIRHVGDRDYWTRAGWYVDAGNIQVPCLFGTGWFDGAKFVTLEHYLNVVNTSRSALARENSRLIIGPWPHGEFVPQVFGGVDFGLAGDGKHYGVCRKHIEWFRHWALGEDTPFMKEAPVQVFLLGENRWQGYSAWPPKEAKEREFYLSGGGDAARDMESGSLLAAPAADTVADHYDYDPADPVLSDVMDPYCANISCYIEGSQRRADVAVYTSPVLEKDVTVAGMVRVVLYAATSAEDTDFACRLTDVYPDGRAMFLAQGLVRARYRNGCEKPDFIEPGKIYEYQIDLSGAGNVFKAGHRIRVDVASSAFPEYDRNHNTKDPVGSGTTLVVAHQTILHGAEYPSRIILPVIE